MTECLCFTKTSEFLVLEGYRHWGSGVIQKDCKYWKLASKLFVERLGEKPGTLALKALTEFATIPGHSAREPLKTCEMGCPRICRDEILILGILAGLQHGDETAITLCLDGLIHQGDHDQVLTAADALACVLRSVDNVLFPIPAASIKAILTDKVSTPTLQ